MVWRMASDEPPGRDISPLMTATRTVTAAIVLSLAQVSRAVTVSQLRVLVMLSSRGRLNLSSVAEGLNVNVSNASRTCERLVRAGYVDRQVDPHDRRHVSLALTRAGRHVVDAVMHHRSELLAAVVAEMPAASQDLLMQGLTAFNEAARRLSVSSASRAEDGSGAGLSAVDVDGRPDSLGHLEGDLVRWLT
jgi:DNA-binding MarR family transcriptional regulator